MKNKPTEETLLVLAKLARYLTDLTNYNKIRWFYHNRDGVEFLESETVIGKFYIKYDVNTTECIFVTPPPDEGKQNKEIKLLLPVGSDIGYALRGLYHAAKSDAEDIQSALKEFMEALNA